MMKRNEILLAGKMTNKIAISVMATLALSVGAYATCASDVDMGTNKITSSAVPSGANDLTNKAYVDSMVANPPVVAPTGYEVIYVNGVAWLDRNLGATKACTTVDGDATCHGDLYQWGRPADGHQVRTSGTQAGPTSGIQPGHGNFLTVSASPYNWLSSNEIYLWSTPGSTNNGVCPAGWSVPTKQDFSALSLTNSGDAFTKLKLTESGYRSRIDGTLNSMGSRGYYWSATVDGENSAHLHIYSGGTYFDGVHRAHGLSVRCLKR